jgi:hypothetical protein
VATIAVTITTIIRTSTGNITAIGAIGSVRMMMNRSLTTH